MKNILKEAKRLHKLGIGIHWLRPGSKAPIDKGWTDSKTKTWSQLSTEYRDGFGLGIKLGRASKLGDHYLAVIDVDVKSGKREHLKQATEVIRKQFPSVLKSAPRVRTGRGFHIYILTEQPVESRKLATSEEQTKVLMPNEPINGVQLKSVGTLITEEELQEGWRVRPAWQVELMSTGKQVVAPPTIHPDTGREYRWEKDICDED